MSSWVVYPSQPSQTPDFADAPNTSTRRHHSKSRKGCSICKTRRIKCDETRPACQQCVNYDRKCSYSSPGLQTVAGDSQSRVTTNQASRDELFEQVWEKLQPVAELCTLSELSIQRATLRALFSHFVDCEDEWLAAPSFRRILQQQGIQLGIQSDYLLHAILAVTATHLQYLDPTNMELKFIYGFHNALSLRAYRDKLNNIQPDDADALHACGAIHTIMVIRHTMLDATANSATLAALEGLLLALKSIKSFPAFHCPFDKETRAKSDHVHRIFSTCDAAGQWSTEVHQQVSEVSLYLNMLESHIFQLAGSAAFEEIYREPFQYLVLIGGRGGHSNPLEMLFSFPDQLQPSFLEALQNRAPVAILLLGYWLAMFSTIKQWWITDDAKKLCAGCFDQLLDILPATLQSREELLAPLAQATEGKSIGRKGEAVDDETALSTATKITRPSVPRHNFKSILLQPDCPITLPDWLA